MTLLGMTHLIVDHLDNRNHNPPHTTSIVVIMIGYNLSVIPSIHIHSQEPRRSSTTKCPHDIHFLQSISYINWLLVKVTPHVRRCSYYHPHVVLRHYCASCMILNKKKSFHFPPTASLSNSKWFHASCLYCSSQCHYQLSLAFASPYSFTCCFSHTTQHNHRCLCLVLLLASWTMYFLYLQSLQSLNQDWERSCGCDRESSM